MNNSPQEIFKMNDNSGSRAARQLASRVEFSRILYFLLTFLTIHWASARPWRPEQIPNGNVNSCANCHVSPFGGGARNAFGQDVETRVSPGSTDEFWSASLAALDSDGDGFSNGTELGDPDGDGTPIAGAQVTNPGSSSSHPTVSAPTVSITAPANNATFSAPATFDINVNAAVSGSTISSVEFFNGGTSLGTDSSAPFSLNVTLSAGTHTLTARAMAANGQNTTSNPIAVTVNAPASAPVVSVTTPANNATFTAPASVEIQVSATVEGSTISMIEFFDGATFLGMDHDEPFTFTANLAAGSHTLTAKATAANGQTAMSGPISVTVNGAAALPVVSITAPANNATVNGTNVTITATASIEGGTITMIEFFDGATFLGMVHGEPFTATANLAEGSHTLTAKATASTGASATSAPVMVTVEIDGGTGGTPIENPYPPLVKTDITVELETIVDGLVSPLGLAAPDDGSNRLFVFDQVGLIHVLTNGMKLAEPLLDVGSRMVDLNEGYDENGLLGLATHPNFAQNPLIYTYTSEPNGPSADFPLAGEVDHQSVIAEWRIDAANPNRIDPASRREILRFDKPQFNHSGGVMHFGSDGMLYIAIGDGGAADDQGSGHSPQGNGQDLNKILGKIIRIDVDGRTSANGQYGIPEGNPFAGADGLDEIYAYGFRNPYSWSFDRLTGEMYVGDVGQNMIEELDRVFSGGNYGWHIKEGTFFFDPNGDEAGFITDIPVTTVPGDLIDPLAEYDHDEGLAIVGGYVYRGMAIPSLLGRYVTADWGKFNDADGRLFVLDRSEFRELRLGIEGRALGQWIKGFGQDQQGELYIMTSTNLGPEGTSGKMLKIVPAANNLMISGITNDDTSLTVSWTGGVGPFVIESKSSLEDRTWRLLSGSTNSTATLPMELNAGFIRVTDTAGIRDSAFTVHMTGAAERPNPVNSSGTGSGTLVIEGNTLHFDIQYSGLTGPATAAHIHGRASASEAAGVLINLAPFNGGAFGSAGTLSGSVTLSPEQKAAILAGETYVNIHTEANGGGEIRGQVAPFLWMADLTGAAERPNPVDTPARGSALFMLVGNELTFEINYAELKTNATASHIHGAAGINGAAGVMVDLAPFNGGSFSSNGTLAGSVTLTDEQLAALVDGLTYVNVHSGVHGGGEIRGQILPKSTAIPLTASLSGAAERPTMVDTPATGTAILALEGNTLHFNIRYNGLKAVANNAHIHGPATAAEAASVMINLVPFHNGPFGTNGTITGSVLITDAQRTEILEGRTYINIHSEAHGGGEIRGQVVPSVMQSVLLGASERPNAVHTTGRGRGTLLLVGNQLSMNLTYSGLSSTANNAHIHGPAPISAAAGVMVGLNALNGGAFGAAGSFNGTVSLNPDQIAALVDGLTYVNIHSGEHGGGEIRGQIVR